MSWSSMFSAAEKKVFLCHPEVLRKPSQMPFWKKMFGSFVIISRASVIAFEKTWKDLGQYQSSCT